MNKLLCQRCIVQQYEIRLVVPSIYNNIEQNEMATASLTLAIISPFKCLSVTKVYKRLRDFELCNVQKKQNLFLTLVGRPSVSRSC